MFHKTSTELQQQRTTTTLVEDERGGHVLVPIFLQITTASAAMWKPEGRRFEVTGTFVERQWKMTHDVFPNENLGLNGRKLIVVTNTVSSRKNMLIPWKNTVWEKDM